MAEYFKIIKYLRECKFGEYRKILFSGEFDKFGNFDQLGKFGKIWQGMISHKNMSFYCGTHYLKWALHLHSPPPPYTHSTCWNLLKQFLL
jgi:hypothetical protein